MTDTFIQQDNNNEKLKNPKLLSPLTLAFMGDVVFELFVREKLIEKGDTSVNNLHNMSVRYVNAVSQSDGLDSILHLLTEEENAIYKRGRNANNNVPKSASPRDYRRATGLEALFGYLYIKGENERLYSLFEIIWHAKENTAIEQITEDN